MGKPVHIVDLLSGSNQANQDRLAVLIDTAVPNVAGSGAGAAVVTAIAVAAGALPASYNVQVTPGQDCTAYVSGKTQSGFNVTLTPRLAGNTLAIGTFDVLVTA